MEGLVVPSFFFFFEIISVSMSSDELFLSDNWRPDAESVEWQTEEV